MKSAILDPNQQEFAPLLYAHADAPVPPKSYTEVMLEMSPEYLRAAAAILVASEGSRCSPPAEEVVLLGDPLAGMWSVRCREGSYTLVLIGDGASRITAKDVEGDSNATPPTGEQAATENPPEQQVAQNETSAQRHKREIGEKLGLGIVRFLKGHEYRGTTYDPEVVSGVAIEPKSSSLVIEIDDPQESSPVSYVVPIASMESAVTLLDGVWGVAFACPTDCIISTNDDIETTVGKLAEGRQGDLNRAAPRGAVFVGCPDEAACSELEQRFRELIDFSRQL
jgi:hypothetical protein